MELLDKVVLLKKEGFYMTVKQKSGSYRDNKGEIMDVIVLNNTSFTRIELVGYDKKSGNYEVLLRKKYRVRLSPSVLFEVCRSSSIAKGILGGEYIFVKVQSTGNAVQLVLVGGETHKMVVKGGR